MRISAPELPDRWSHHEAANMQLMSDDNFNSPQHLFVPG